MIGYLKAERLKLKASTSKKVLLAIPLFFLLFSLFTVIFINQEGASFNAYLALVFNQWPLVFLPIGLAIACSMNIRLEKRSGSYKFIVSNNLSLAKTWYSKIFSLMNYQLLSSLFMIVVAAGGSMLIFHEVPDLMKIIKTTFLITIVALPLIPFNYIVAQYFGTIITVGANLLGTFISVIWLAPYSIFWLMPWSTMLRIPAVTMRIHPNGTPIEGKSSLIDASIIGSSISVSVMYFVLLFVLSTFVFKKKVRK